MVKMCTQDRLTGRLSGLYEEGKGLRDTLRLALVAVGRGGQGDVGQRIRDEILTVQSNNGAKVARFFSNAPRAILFSLTGTVMGANIGTDHCQAVVQRKVVQHSNAR